MTTPVLSQRDFNWIELLKVRVQNLASAPSTPQLGWVYYDTTLNKMRVCTNPTGPVWVNMDGSDIPDSTVTSAKIADGAIMNIDINASAAIALSKLATDPLARAGHTGTQLAATISDLATVVKAYKLSEFAAAIADLNFGGFKGTNLAEPVSSGDAATKNYVDLARQGIRLKDAVRVASTVNLTLSGTQTIDGIAVNATDRVLVKNQSTPSQNGIYAVAAGAWARTTDADVFGELNDGVTVWVNEGTQGNTTWSQTATLTSLSDSQTWSQQGSASSYTGGNGIDITGSVVSIKGPGNGILADGTSTRVDPSVVARKYTVAIGNASATSFVINHALANQWVTVQVFETTGSFRLVEVDVELTDANNCTVKFAVAPASNAYRVVVVG